MQGTAAIDTLAVKPEVAIKLLILIQTFNF